MLGIIKEMFRSTDPFYNPTVINQSQLLCSTHPHTHIPQAAIRCVGGTGPILFSLSEPTQAPHTFRNAPNVPTNEGKVISLLVFHLSFSWILIIWMCDVVIRVFSVGLGSVELLPDPSVTRVLAQLCA